MDILENNMNTTNDNFCKMCMCGNAKEIKDYIEKFNIDVNYDDGYFLEIVCLRNDINILKLFVEHGANVHLNNEGILRIVAHEGHVDLLKYLVNECKSDYTQVYNSTAYSNNENTQTFIDECKKNILYVC